MALPIWKKYVFGVLGTVVLGALGSGLWELAFRPFGQWLGGAVLTAATFGSTAIKDGVYRDAARGSHDAASLFLLSMSALALLVLAAFTLGLSEGRRKMAKERDKWVSKFDALDGESKVRAMKEDVAKDRRKLELLFFCFFSLLGAMVQISYLRLYESNRAYTYFAQSMAICRPYIDDQQARMLESRFAGIDGRVDYLAIISDLKGVATSNKRQLPVYDPW